jgi:hypothetical protein
MQFKLTAVAVALAATVMASASVVPAEMSGAVRFKFYASCSITDLGLCRYDECPPWTRFVRFKLMLSSCLSFSSRSYFINNSEGHVLGLITKRGCNVGERKCFMKVPARCNAHNTWIMGKPCKAPTPKWALISLHSTFIFKISCNLVAIMVFVLLKQIGLLHCTIVIALLYRYRVCSELMSLSLIFSDCTVRLI